MADSLSLRPLAYIVLAEPHRGPVQRSADFKIILPVPHGQGIRAVPLIVIIARVEAAHRGDILHVCQNEHQILTQRERSIKLSVDSVPDKYFIPKAMDQIRVI